MSKLKMVLVLMLVDHPVEIDGETRNLKSGEVVELPEAAAFELVKQGAADATPANIAFHSGDEKRYNELIVQAAAAAAKTSKAKA